MSKFVWFSSVLPSVQQRFHHFHSFFPYRRFIPSNWWRRTFVSGCRFPSVEVGTLCRGMSRRRRHWLSSGNASRLASSIVPYPKCPVVPAQWFVMSDTIMNVLLTYLLHAIPTYTIFKSIWFSSAQLWRNRSNLTRTLYRCTLLLRIQ